MPAARARAGHRARAPRPARRQFPTWPGTPGTPTSWLYTRGAVGSRIALASTTSASYLGTASQDPIVAPSALKHGLDKVDILHAYRNPIRVWDLGDGFTMMVGANRAAIILEIGYVEGVEAVVIVHAMRAQEKFLR